MGIHRKGMLTQKFKIRCDVQNLAENIAEHIRKTISEDKSLSDVEIDESYFEDDELVVTGSYATDFEYWHYDQTLETPEENDIDRGYIGNAPWIIADLPKEIKENISILEVKEDDDMIVGDEW